MQTIGRTIIDVYRDAWQLLLRQWPAILIIAASDLAFTLVDNLMQPPVANDAAQLLVRGALDIADLWVTAPAMVALFRHLILGESADPSPLHRSALSNAYFIASAGVSLMLTFAALWFKLHYLNPQSAFDKIALAMGHFVIQWIVYARLATYLPGVAAGRSPKSFWIAFVEAKGHALRIVATLAATVAPAFIAAVAVGLAIHGITLWQTTLLLILPTIPLTLLGTAAGALLYRQLKRDDLAQQTVVQPPLPSPTPQRSFGRSAYRAPAPAASTGSLGLDRPSPITIAGAAYTDLIKIAREMWPVLLILSALYFVCAMAWFIAPMIVSTWVGRMVIRMVIFIGIAWLLAPYYIALHRFVATGEVRWIPSFESYGAASKVYFGWAGMTIALWFLPLILGDTIDAFASPLGSVIALLSYFVIWPLLTRVTTLLPTAALEPERAGWAQAMADSRGRFWSFFLSTTIAVLPATLVLLLIAGAAGSQTIQALPFFALAVPALLIIQLIPLAAGTRLYEGLPRDALATRMQQVIRPR